MVWSSAAGGKGSKGTAGKRSLFLLYLDAVSVVNQRGANQSCKDTTDQISQPVDHLPSHQATSFTLRDLHFIVKFSQVTIQCSLKAAILQCSVQCCSSLVHALYCSVSCLKDTATDVMPLRLHSTLVCLVSTNT